MKVDIIEGIIAELKSLIISLDAKGYFVGGYVRDLLVNKESTFTSNDLDIIFRGDIEKFIRALKEKKFKIFTLKAELGIYRATKDGIQIDIALLKGNSLYQDLVLRDFTINSIAMEINTGEILDYFHGISHIKSRMLKETKVGSIYNDPVRILRALRFALMYNLQIEDTTLKSIIKESKKLLSSPKERLFIELMKIIKVDINGNLEALLSKIQVELNIKIQFKTYNIYRNLLKTEVYKNKYAKIIKGKKIGDYYLENYIAMASILLDNVEDRKNNYSAVNNFCDTFGFPKAAQLLIKKILIGHEFILNNYEKNLETMKVELYYYFKEVGNYLTYILFVTYCKIASSSNVEFEKYFYKFNKEFEKFSLCRNTKLISPQEIIELTGVKGKTISEAIEFLDKEVYLERVKTKEKAKMEVINKYLC